MTFNTQDLNNSPSHKNEFCVRQFISRPEIG